MKALAGLARLARQLEGGRVVAAIFHGLSELSQVDAHAHPGLHGARRAHRHQPCKPMQGDQQAQDEGEQAAHSGDSRSPPKVVRH
jgi:hypothetical protein